MSLSFNDTWGGIVKSLGLNSIIRLQNISRISDWVATLKDQWNNEFDFEIFHSSNLQFKVSTTRVPFYHSWNFNSNIWYIAAELKSWTIWDWSNNSSSPLLKISREFIEQVFVCDLSLHGFKISFSLNKPFSIHFVSLYNYFHFY